MSTMKRIIANGPARAAVAAIVLPRLFPVPAVSLGERARRRIVACLAAAGIAAGAAYVVSVNAILLHGEAIKRDRRAVAALEQDYALLQTELLARQSPAWLEERATADGMVTVTGVRYLSAQQSVALFR